jgi:predicted transport protein
MDAIEKATQTQIANIEKAYGKSVSEWAVVLKGSGFSKHGELVNFLKEVHGLTHGNANTLVHVANQSHAGAAENETDWIAEQYKGKEEMKPWYDAIMEMVSAMGSDIEIAPKKAYVSLRRKKQFAIIQPSTKTRMDIGLNIKGKDPSGMAEKAGSWNTMCTHRIKLESAANINDELKEWIAAAYEQAG